MSVRAVLTGLLARSTYLVLGVGAVFGGLVAVHFSFERSRAHASPDVTLLLLGLCSYVTGGLLLRTVSRSNGRSDAP